MDTEGRSIVFDIENVTFSNVYFPSGNNLEMRNNRENYASKILPQLLINSKDAGIVGGDWNCIVREEDATKNASQKMSKFLKRLIKTLLGRIALGLSILTQKSSPGIMRMKNSEMEPPE